MKLAILSISIATLLVGCSQTAITSEPQKVRFTDGNALQIEIEELFTKIEVGMTAEQVIAIMKTPPQETHEDAMWRYVGNNAETEPIPVRYVYLIRFRDGRVSSKERSLSDCIAQRPRESGL